MTIMYVKHISNSYAGNTHQSTAMRVGAVFMTIMLIKHLNR